MSIEGYGAMKDWALWGSGVVLLGMIGVLGMGVPSDAITNPISGAVSKPGDFQVSWPFEDGERVYVTAGYGPGGGSSLHNHTSEAGRANDYYALDLVLPDYPNGGLGRPVLSMASGTVLKAGWATAGWANYGLRVIIRHDYTNNGDTFVTHYAHLDELSVQEGQRVERGQQIGTLGDSCQGDAQNRSCPFFNAHLHVAMHRNANVGGSGTGGSYGGNAVVMEPIDGAENIAGGQTHTSGNNGQPPAPCQVIGRDEAIISDDGPCLRRFGPPQYWHEENQGHNNNAFWTYTIDAPQPDNHVRWALNFEQAGQYEVFAYIPAAFGQSEQARYVVRHDGEQTNAVRSQRSAPDNWLSLGRFDFAQGGDQWVMLEDNTGEPYVDANNNRKIVFDALRVVRADPNQCECEGNQSEFAACGRCGTQERTCDGCNWVLAGECTGQGVCSPQDLEEQACGIGGVQRRVCDDACQWGPFTACNEDGDPPLPDAGMEPDGGMAPDAGPQTDVGQGDDEDVVEDRPDSGDEVDPDMFMGSDDDGDTRRSEVKGCATAPGEGAGGVWWWVLGLVLFWRRRALV